MRTCALLLPTIGSPSCRTYGYWSVGEPRIVKRKLVSVADILTRSSASVSSTGNPPSLISMRHTRACPCCAAATSGLFRCDVTSKENSKPSESRKKFKQQHPNDHDCAIDSHRSCNPGADRLQELRAHRGMPEIRRMPQRRAPFLRCISRSENDTSYICPYNVTRSGARTVLLLRCPLGSRRHPSRQAPCRRQCGHHAPLQQEV